jgi:hypothetical protein
MDSHLYERNVWIGVCVCVDEKSEGRQQGRDR